VQKASVSKHTGTKNKKLCSFKKRAWDFEIKISTDGENQIELK
jgi:hypothetical protein